MYQLSVDSFKKTFAVKEDGSHLTHNSGKKFKLFPFIANNNVEPVRDLQRIVGKYLSQIQGKEPVPITADELIAKLKDDTENSIQLGTEEIFDQVVRYMFFDKAGNIRPNNLKMIEQIPCTDSIDCRLADYLVDVLGDLSHLKQSMDEAEHNVDLQNNALEKFAISKLSFKPSIKNEGDNYQRITNAVASQFESDFEYVVSSQSRTRDYIIPLLEFYYFTYTAQAILQLNRFMEGNRDKCVPLYFCVEWEKTSQNRLCFTQGWNLLQDAASRMFAHAVVLEILNQTEGQQSPIDYITLNQLVQEPSEDHRIAEQIRVLTDCYRNAITDCAEMNDLHRVEDLNAETATELKFLFDSVRCQFENTSRERPYNSYAAKFTEYSKKYLKNRGRSGLMLNLSEETLIFLTKVCIQDREKMRLNDVFSEFELRGVFLDNHSKSEVMRYYEKLNLIEKKSDSGDAQYVKRIL